MTVAYFERDDDQDVAFAVFNGWPQHIGWVRPIKNDKYGFVAIDASMSKRATFATLIAAGEWLVSEYRDPFPWLHP